MAKLRLHELNRLDADAFRAAPKTSIVVVLDQVRSLHNVGSLFRTSDAFRLEGIHLCGLTAHPPHPEMEKTALGATEVVDWTPFPTAADSGFAANFAQKWTGTRGNCVVEIRRTRLGRCIRQHEGD